MCHHMKAGLHESLVCINLKDIVKPSIQFIIITMVKVNSTVNGNILTFLTHRGLQSPWSQGISPWS